MIWSILYDSGTHIKKLVINSNQAIKSILKLRNLVFMNMELKSIFVMRFKVITKEILEAGMIKNGPKLSINRQSPEIRNVLT